MKRKQGFQEWKETSSQFEIAAMHQPALDTVNTCSQTNV